MREFHYALIRYVSDRLRMEPINVGIVLQDASGARVKFSPHAAKRADVDTEAFRKWKAFLEAEVKNDVDPLFRPPTDSSAFLPHLARLCDGPVVMSRPLVIADESESSADQMFEALFRRLVLPKEESATSESLRPTGRYREFETEFQLTKRGVRKHATVPFKGVEAGADIHRRPYRQVANGQYIVMDKIEVARELSRTAEELNALSNVRSFLNTFLKVEIQDRKTRYILLADDLTQAFGDQSTDEFKSMRDDINRTVDIVQEAGGEVIRDPAGSEALAKDLDRDLTPLNSI